MWANLFLALAISSKLYPAVFLLLLASDRRWRDCVAVIAITIAINLVALLFFQGGVWENARMFVGNVLMAARAEGLLTGRFPPVMDAAWSISFCNLLRVPCALFLHCRPPYMSYYYPVFALGIIAALACALRCEQVFWKRVLIVTIAAVGLPSISNDYNLIYLVIPLLLYLHERTPFCNEDYFYLATLGLLFVPKHYYILDWIGVHVMSVQAFLNPLILLVIFVKVVWPHRPWFGMLTTEGRSLSSLSAVQDLRPGAPGLPRDGGRLRQLR
jgi:hypothetical protein